MTGNANGCLGADQCKDIPELIDILGKDWINTEVGKYATFRQKYSPTDLWAHRHPNTSPIIPLLYQLYNPDERRRHQYPIGYWYGNPIVFLSIIAGSIALFRDYWINLPKSIGKDNIRAQLTKADLFNGFIFELLVADDSKTNRYVDYEIIPQFFNPKSTRGSADIILKKGDIERAIQCKTINPLASAQMSFDMFQYLFGLIYRLVCDTGYSYKICIELKGKLTVTDIHSIWESSIEPAISSGIHIPKTTINPSYNIKLDRLNIPLTGISKKEVSILFNAEKANLYSEVGAYPSGISGSSKYNKIALFYISASRYEPIEKTILRVAKQTAKIADVDCPLIIAIHLYQGTALHSYLNEIAQKVEFKRNINRFFQAPNGRNVESIDISSNKQVYENRGTNLVALRTEGVSLVNPFFENYAIDTS